MKKKRKSKIFPLHFEEIINAKLWAVKYANETTNELDRLLDEWEDVEKLYQFFEENYEDLAFFEVNDINIAVEDTLIDRDNIESLFLNPRTNLERLFRPLDNRVGRPGDLEQMKARVVSINHPSWLRIYAIRLSEGIFIITGGAIKLTEAMNEREHLRRELVKILAVRDYLIGLGIIDIAGFEQLLEED